MTLIDKLTRKCHAIKVARRIHAVGVTEELADAMTFERVPVFIRSDNGTEFTSHAIFTWVKDQRIEWQYIIPGKPLQNGYVESFSGKIRGGVAE